jgi:hypothetical protein
MDIPRALASVTVSNLAMPIEENLSPQLPPLNYKKEFWLRPLVSTQSPTETLLESNTIVGNSKDAAHNS